MSAKARENSRNNNVHEFTRNYTKVVREIVHEITRLYTKVVREIVRELTRINAKRIRVVTFSDNPFTYTPFIIHLQ